MAAVIDARTLLPRLSATFEARLATSRFAGARVELDVRSELLGEHTSASLSFGPRTSAPPRRLALDVRGGQLARIVFGYRPAAVFRELALPAEGAELAGVLFPDLAPFMQPTDRF